jgi:hypothetical protein
VKKLIMTAALLLVLPLGSADAMFRFCFEPTAPSFGFVRKPTKPYCAAARNCTEWEVSSYKADVERYFKKLKQYAEEVDAYYVQAGDYVKCMAVLD